MRHFLGISYELPQDSSLEADISLAADSPDDLADEEGDDDLVDDFHEAVVRREAEEQEIRNN